MDKRKSVFSDDEHRKTIARIEKRMDDVMDDLILLRGHDYCLSETMLFLAETKKQLNADLNNQRFLSRMNPEFVTAGFFSFLPDELFECIFIHLDFKSLFKLSWTCKVLRSLVLATNVWWKFVIREYVGKRLTFPCNPRKYIPICTIHEDKHKAYNSAIIDYSARRNISRLKYSLEQLHEVRRETRYTTKICYDVNDEHYITITDHGCHMHSFYGSHHALNDIYCPRISRVRLYDDTFVTLSKKDRSLTIYDTETTTMTLHIIGGIHTFDIEGQILYDSTLMDIHRTDRRDNKREQLINPDRISELKLQMAVNDNLLCAEFGGKRRVYDVRNPNTPLISENLDFENAYQTIIPFNNNFYTLSGRVVVEYNVSCGIVRYQPIFMNDYSWLVDLCVIGRELVLFANESYLAGERFLHTLFIDPIQFSFPSQQAFKWDASISTHTQLLHIIGGRYWAVGHTSNGACSYFHSADKDFLKIFNFIH